MLQYILVQYLRMDGALVKKLVWLDLQLRGPRSEVEEGWNKEAYSVRIICEWNCD
jgi:hypothetical protein